LLCLRLQIQTRAAAAAAAAAAKRSSERDGHGASSLPRGRPGRRPLLLPLVLLPRRPAAAAATRERGGAEADPAGDHAGAGGGEGGAEAEGAEHRQAVGPGARGGQGARRRAGPGAEPPPPRCPGRAAARHVQRHRLRLQPRVVPRGPVLRPRHVRRPRPGSSSSASPAPGSGRRPTPRSRCSPPRGPCRTGAACWPPSWRPGPCCRTCSSPGSSRAGATRPRCAHRTRCRSAPPAPPGTPTTRSRWPPAAARSGRWPRPCPCCPPPAARRASSPSDRGCTDGLTAGSTVVLCLMMTSETKRLKKRSMMVLDANCTVVLSEP
uniref:Uncharacterized protein n=1 Tax=Zea mays TaxID=4577 RepID=A0A804QSX0_MAIZE